MHSRAIQAIFRLITAIAVMSMAFVSFCQAGASSSTAACRKWDYYYYPVNVSGVSAPANPHFRLAAAFDGYPANPSQAYPSADWRTLPEQKNAPIYVTIDYGKPITATKYVHFFNDGAVPTAWKDADISGSSDNKSWKLLQEYRNLAPDLPQVLAIDKPGAYRYYRIDVKALVGNASALSTYEIETYTGTAVGSIIPKGSRVVQSEKADLTVHVLSPEAKLNQGTLKLIAPAGSIAGDSAVRLPVVQSGGSALVSIPIKPMTSGPIPMKIELWEGSRLIDTRPYVLRVEPKLVFKELSLGGAVTAAVGKTVKLSGTVVNSGLSGAGKVKITWMGRSAALPNLAPGQSAKFTISSVASKGYSEGVLSASDISGARTNIRRSIICPTSGPINAHLDQTNFQFTSSKSGIRIQAKNKAGASVTGALALYVSGKQQALNMVDYAPKTKSLVAVLPGAVLLIDIPSRAAGNRDAELKCRVIPDDPRPLTKQFLDVEFRVSVDKPKIMFRPHIDWYTVEHGPNKPQLANGHNSTTRMLCIQTDSGSLSMVPDTDNLTWGFTPDSQMTAHFRVPLLSDVCVPADRWRPIDESPTRFSIKLPLTGGNWWNAYRHVVEDIFKFEQPRQWAMPITQMQMLTSRELMSYQAWSEKYQIIRCLNNDYAFWTFYATVYSTPALYQWYLATDNKTAKIKAEKMIDWLLKVQHNEKPMEGAWFTAYHAQPNSNELIGGDFIKNRWIIPHGTGAVVKCLLWYYDVSGRTDKRVFDASRRGCEWLLKTMRDDGGWPYAFETDGTVITQACGAGQIWNTWALWRMYKITGEVKFRDAAIKSKQFFKKEYMEDHRYVGYWEDTVGITKDANKSIRSWEGYEPAIAVQVFSEMGDNTLALEAAKDTAVWSWTRVTSTRQYENSYGQTTEQAMCGPSQAQSPMVGIAFHRIYEKTGDKLWSDFSGAVKSVNFCADPDLEYGMVATTGWLLPLQAVAGPPYDNVRPWVTPDMDKGDYGRQLWTGWCTDQFAWLALEWLIREGNLRAPQYVSIDPEKLRGMVMRQSGRVKMPEEKCDVTGIDHRDINWVGYSNDAKYMLLVMNHKEKTRVMVYPHEAHLDVYCRPPKILIGSGKNFKEARIIKNGMHYEVSIPANANAIFVWDRIK